MTLPATSPNLAAIMEQIESISPEEAKTLFWSSFRSFQSDFQENETVKGLLNEMRKSLQNREIVLRRLLALFKESADAAPFAESTGFAQASYLYGLYRTEPDLAHGAITEILATKRYSWANTLAFMIQSAEKSRERRNHLKEMMKIPALVRESGLGDYVEAILPYATPCIRLRAYPSDNPASLPAGASYIGGLPDLPRNLKWPTRHGRFCEFVAQINLSEASAHDPTGLLPKEGLLAFFFDGRDYEDVEAGAQYKYEHYQKGSEVLYYFTGNLLSLERAKSLPDSLDQWQRYRTCSIQFETEWMLPGFGTRAYYQMRRDVFHGTYAKEPETPDMKAYYEMTNHLTPEADEEKHHLFGYPEPVIQDDPFFEIPWDKQKSEEEALPEWVLLLQISSNDGAGMLWGDTSSLYYCISKDDLVAKRFENAVGILQSL